VLEPVLGLFEAQRIAQAWDGDRYNVYEHGPNGPLGLVWVTVWDNEADAGAFEEAYKTVAQKLGVTAKLNRNGKRVLIRQASQEAFFALSEAALPQ
jgi:hypothetical protein